MTNNCRQFAVLLCVCHKQQSEEHSATMFSLWTFLLFLVSGSSNNNKDTVKYIHTKQMSSDTISVILFFPGKWWQRPLSIYAAKPEQWSKHLHRQKHAITTVDDCCVSTIWLIRGVLINLRQNKRVRESSPLNCTLWRLRLMLLLQCTLTDGQRTVKWACFEDDDTAVAVVPCSCWWDAHWDGQLE